MTTEAPAATAFACPACRTRLDEKLGCPGCGRSFERVAGIPDLRVDYRDPHVSWEDDLELARDLDARSGELDFEGLLREHWRRSGRRPELLERFVAGDLGALRRADEVLDAIAAARGGTDALAGDVLEVGSGTAALAARASRRARRVVASDAAMRWLVLARKQLEQAGAGGVELVCCTGEDPPFLPESFDLVLASDLIEHVQDQARLVESCHRILRPGGMLFLATPNRFSLWLEPHVRLWGVGLLPRAAARRYVELVRGTPYHVRLLSALGLRRLLVRAGFDVEIAPPAPAAGERASQGGVEVRLVRAYGRLRERRAARGLLLAVGPFFHVVARKVPSA